MCRKRRNPAEQQLLNSFVKNLPLDEQDKIAKCQPNNVENFCKSVSPAIANDLKDQALSSAYFLIASNMDFGNSEEINSELTNAINLVSTQEKPEKGFESVYKKMKSQEQGSERQILLMRQKKPKLFTPKYESSSIKIST